jgi:tetratricopeptide (TPR) repeat protein
MCDCFNLLGALAVSVQDYQLASRRLGQAVRLARSLRDSERLGWIGSNLALVESGLGRYENALALARESLAAGREIDDGSQIARGLCQMGNFLLFMGRWRDAVAPLQEALHVCERRRIQTLKPTAQCHLGRAYLELRDLAKARGLLEQAITNAHALHRERMEVLALGSMVALEALEGNVEAARRTLAKALDLVQGEKLNEEGFICIVASGDVEWAAGRQAHALSIWRWAATCEAFDIPDRDVARLKLDRALREAPHLVAAKAADADANSDASDTPSLADMLRQAERLCQGDALAPQVK